MAFTLRLPLATCSTLPLAPPHLTDPLLVPPPSLIPVSPPDFLPVCMCEWDTLSSLSFLIGAWHRDSFTAKSSPLSVRKMYLPSSVSHWLCLAFYRTAWSQKPFILPQHRVDAQVVQKLTLLWAQESSTQIPAEASVPCSPPHSPPFLPAFCLPLPLDAPQALEEV